MVLVSQGIGHTSHHLLIGSLHLRGEFFAKVVSQHTHKHTHLEVLGIHVQLVTVKLTELSKGALEVVQVFQAITKGVQHLLAMGLHFSIAHNSIRSGQVPKGVKEPLSPGPALPHGYQPAQGLTANFVHIHLAPQAGDKTLLFSSQMHHGVCLWLLVNTVVSEANVSSSCPCSSFYAQP
uniref:Uncharacterized protein n=3 Tax=Canis lupus TaxID=9612 RepID=A0A8I3PE20_CANLF